MSENISSDEVCYERATPYLRWVKAETGRFRLQQKWLKQFEDRLEEDWREVPGIES